MAIVARNSNDQKWSTFIDCFRSGTEKKEALAKSGLSTRQLDALLLSSSQRQVQYEETKTIALRAEWSIAQLEEIMDALISREEEGNLKRILEKRERNHADFLRMAERDSFVKAMYAEARALQAETLADELVDIAAKGGKESSQTVTTLKWLMSNMNDKYNSAKKETKEKESTAQLEIMLEEGRKRVEKLHAEREKVKQSEDEEEYLAFG